MDGPPPSQYAVDALGDLTRAGDGAPPTMRRETEDQKRWRAWRKRRRRGEEQGADGGADYFELDYDGDEIGAGSSRRAVLPGQRSSRARAAEATSFLVEASRGAGQHDDQSYDAYTKELVRTDENDPMFVADSVEPAPGSHGGLAGSTAPATKSVGAQSGAGSAPSANGNATAAVEQKAASDAKQEKEEALAKLTTFGLAKEVEHLKTELDKLLHENRADAATTPATTTTIPQCPTRIHPSTAKCKCEDTVVATANQNKICRKVSGAQTRTLVTCPTGTMPTDLAEGTDEFIKWALCKPCDDICGSEGAFKYKEADVFDCVAKTPDKDMCAHSLCQCSNCHAMCHSCTRSMVMNIGTGNCECKQSHIGVDALGGGTHCLKQCARSTTSQLHSEMCVCLNTATTTTTTLAPTASGSASSSLIQMKGGAGGSGTTTSAGTSTPAGGSSSGGPPPGGTSTSTAQKDKESSGTALLETDLDAFVAQTGAMERGEGVPDDTNSSLSETGGSSSTEEPDVDDKEDKDEPDSKNEEEFFPDKNDDDHDPKEPNDPKDDAAGATAKEDDSTTPASGEGGEESKTSFAEEDDNQRAESEQDPADKTDKNEEDFPVYPVYASFLQIDESHHLVDMSVSPGRGDHSTTGTPAGSARRTALVEELHHGRKKEQTTRTRAHDKHGINTRKGDPTTSTTSSTTGGPYPDRAKFLSKSVFGVSLKERAKLGAAGALGIPILDDVSDPQLVETQGYSAINFTHTYAVTK